MPINKDKKRRPSAAPRGIGRLLQVLRAMAVARKPLSLAELATLVDMPRSSLFVLLKGMEQKGYLAFEDNAYTLGPEAFKLGHAIAHSASFPGTALPILRRLGRETGETAILSKLSDDRKHVIYVTVLEGSNLLRFTVTPGVLRPLSATASGQVVLAYMAGTERDAYIASGSFEKFTASTVSTGSALRRAIATAKGRRWAMTVDGTVVGVVGIAAAWFDADGSAAGAVSIAAPSARVLDRQHDIAGVVLRAAEEVSRVMGYAGHYPPKESH